MSFVAMNNRVLVISIRYCFYENVFSFDEAKYSH